MDGLQRNKRGDGRGILQQRTKASRIRVIQVAVKETANNVEHWMAEAYPVTHFSAEYTDTSGFNVFGGRGIEGIDRPLVERSDAAHDCCRACRKLGRRLKGHGAAEPEREKRGVCEVATESLELAAAGFAVSVAAARSFAVVSAHCERNGLKRQLMDRRGKEMEADEPTWDRVKESSR